MLGINTIEKYIKAAEALEATALKMGGMAELKKITDQTVTIKADLIKLDTDIHALAAELGVDFDLLVKDIK